MSWLIIVASADTEQGVELKKGAAAIAASITASGDSAVIEVTSSAAGVRGLLRGTNKDLLIATATLPEQPSVPASQNMPGLELIRSIQSQASPAPCILVSDCPDHGRLAEKLPRCRWLEVGPTTD